MNTTLSVDTRAMNTALSVDLAAMNTALSVDTVAMNTALSVDTVAMNTALSVDTVSTNKFNIVSFSNFHTVPSVLTVSYLITETANTSVTIIRLIYFGYYRKVKIRSL